MSKKVGIAGIVVDVADGSGLSLLDRVTPRSMVAAARLRRIARTGDRCSTRRCRSTASRERSSVARKGTPARGNLHAKTGTTNTVAALGGYVTAKNGEVLAFSLIYNGTDRWNAKTAMDQIGATMAEFVREVAWPGTPPVDRRRIRIL